MSRRSSIRFNTSSFDARLHIPFLRYPSHRPVVTTPPGQADKVARAMIKVLVAALVGTLVGIVIMVVVIAISGTGTTGASSQGLGTLPLSTYTPSGSTPPSTSTPSGGGSSGGGSTGATGDPTAGKAVWDANGCGGCHTLAAAGSSGVIGPDLDTALTKDAGSTPLAAFVKESIIDPSKFIAPGFSDGIMPKTFNTLSATDLNNLVALIIQGK
jgi:cytochrome c551/c552